MQDSVSYNRWAREALGIEVHDSLEYRSEAGVRGVYCNETIEAGTLVKIPFSSLLTMESIESKFKDLREDDQLALFLLQERRKGTASRWARHLSVLPSSYDTVFTWKKGELENFVGSSVHTLSLRLRDQLRSDFQQLPRDFTFDEYQWALSTIWSRFVSVRRRERVYKAMAPVFDMFNHDPHCTTMDHHFNEEEDAFVLVSSKTWTTDHQIFINYGKLTDAKLALFYGFLLPTPNPFNHVDIWATMTTEAPNYQRKHALLYEMGFHHDKEPFHLDGSFPDRLVSCLRIQRMTPDEMHIPLEDGIITHRNEIEVLAALLAALDDMLDQYETTLEQDLMLLPTLDDDDDDDDETRRTRIAITLHVGEKRILRSTISAVDDRLQSLSS